MGPSEGPYPRHTKRLQRCLKSRRHCPKKRRLRRQTINLASPRRIRAWDGGRLPETRGCRFWRARHKCWLSGIHVWRLRPTATGTRTHPTRSVYRQTRLTELCPDKRCRTSVTYLSATVLRRPILILTRTCGWIQICISISWRCHQVKAFLSNVLPSTHRMRIIISDYSFLRLFSNKLVLKMDGISLNDFNGMATCLGLFHAAFIVCSYLHFFIRCFFRVFFFLHAFQLNMNDI